VEKNRSQHHSKTTMQPLVVSSWYKVEPSDLVLDLVASDSNATSCTQPPQPVVKLESRTIDLTMSDADATSHPQSPQPRALPSPPYSYRSPLDSTGLHWTPL